VKVLDVFKIIIAAALVALALLVVAVNIKLPQGYKIFVVQGGSMEPSINIGSLVITNSAPSFVSPVPSPRFQKGDIITSASGKNAFVSHRVVDVVEKNNNFFYKTKGDANKTPDQKLISENEVIGKVSWVVLYLGRLVNFVKQPFGYFLMIIIPSIYVILSETWTIISEIRKSRVKIPPSSASIALPIALVFVASIYFVGGTSAFFSDTANSTNNVFTAAESFGPPIAQTLVVNEFLWSSACTPNPDQKFWIELFNGSADTVNLKDWRFKDADGTTIQISNANAFISPGAYVLITKSASTFTGCYTNQGGVIVLNLGGNPDFSPTATGGVIKLEKPDGSGGFIVVDRSNMGPSKNGGVLNAGTDQSIARSPNGADSALGDTFDPDDFAVDTTPSAGVSN